LSALPHVLKVREIAALERVDPATVSRWCRTGRLPSYRVNGNYRVRRDDYEAFKIETEPEAGIARVATNQRPSSTADRQADRVLDRAGV
jgi:excisionase family DNA binding protein